MHKQLWILVLPALFVTLAVFIYPVVAFLIRSVSYPVWGLQNYQAIFDGMVYYKVMWTTVEISLLVTIGCFILGYPLSHLIATAQPVWQRLLIFVVLVPFWSSVLVRSFAWMVILQNKGIINTWLLKLGIIDRPLQMIYDRTGVLVGMIHVLLPLMILPMYSVMSRIDPRYWDAAATLGATPARNFIRVYFPMSLPGVYAGSVLVFIVSLGFYLTPALLGGPGDTMIALLIVSQAGLGEWGLAAGLSCILIAGVGVTYLLASTVGRSIRHE